MSSLEFSVDERLAFAETLPSSWYTDPNIHEQEKQRVFSCTWQLAGQTEQVVAPGDYFTTSLVSEPVLVVRSADQTVRAFSNVCRHRAGPVATGIGNRRVFQCGYHGWIYALDGRLLVTPEFEGVECFSKEQKCLPEFKVDTWGPLVFVNLDPKCSSLSETLEDLPDRMQQRGFSEFRLAARKEWYLECNWKVYVDNYLEGYHIPVVHPSLSRELDYAAYRTETRRFYSVQHSPIRRVDSARLRISGSGENDDARFYWIFPNLMLNVYPDNYSTNLVVPLGPDRMMTVFEWYFRDPDQPETKNKIQSTVEFSDQIQIEDIAICEAVQRGLRSRTYGTGRYSVKRENGVHHFHRLLAEFCKK